jgi:putative transposase
VERDARVARAEPKKKPRASFQRFVNPAPNACWQLDGTEYVLIGGRKCVIFQPIDDHARLAVASHVAWGQTSEAAIAVVKKGIAARGIPQRLLSDNGAALNPSRRGVLGQLVAYLKSLGVESITGKRYKPTMQGKNERFHRPCSDTSTNNPWPRRSSNYRPNPVSVRDVLIPELSEMS